MNTALLLFAASICLSSAYIWGTLFWGVRKVRWLRDVAIPDTLVWPRVSIIVPARNEEREIEEALQSLLALDYPDYEVLVVNDRSTDRTGEILAAMQQRFPQLTIATVVDLPAGWLGKNHALACGARQATGEILLFTDADIIMHPDTLRRSVTYFQTQQLDHLAMTPDVAMPTWFLESFIVVFIMLFSILTKPWKVRDPKSPAHIGIGAFNMLRASVYQAIGTHQPIAMRPDDDLKLGKLVKKQGYVQDVLNGSGFILVRWYASLRELIHGLMKNAFSGVDYHVGFTLFSSVSLLLVNVWPFLAVWITTGATWWFYVATVAMHLTSYSLTAQAAKARWWGLIAYPLVFVLFVFIQWRAMCLTFWNDGIYWRDTHYSLAELRANRV